MAYIGEYILYLLRNKQSREQNKTLNTIYSVWIDFQSDVNNNVYPVEQSLLEKKKYIQHDMQIEILNNFFCEDSLNLNIYQKQISEIRGEFDKQLSQLGEMKEKLDEYKFSFTFVGLAQGFENLLSKKETAK